MRKTEALAAGRVLWLQKTRPTDIPIEIRPIAAEKLDIEVKEVSEKIEDSTSSNIDTIVSELNSFPEKVSGEGYHVVGEGETLFSLSRDYNVSLVELKSLNNLSSDELVIGQQLRVIDVAPKQESELVTVQEFKVYIVIKGDTMFSLSKKFDVSTDEIKVWNNKTDNSLSLGEEIKIKK